MSNIPIMVVVVVMVVIGSEAPGQCFWQRGDELPVPHPQLGGQFGSALALHDDVAVVGAPGEDDGSGNSGAVYVLRRGGNDWLAEQELTPDPGPIYSQFGRRVSVHGDWIVCRGVENLLQQAVYFYLYDGATWALEQTITLPGNIPDAGLALSGDDCAVGDAAAGIVRVYSYDGAQWSETAQITSPFFGGAAFGEEVALGPDLLMVGAASATSPLNSGRVVVYRRAAGVWSQDQVLAASDIATQRRFGEHLALSGDVALIGSEDVQAGASSTAYFFRQDGGSWSEESKVPAPDQDLFLIDESPLAVSGDWALIGTPAREGSRGCARVYRHDGSRWSLVQRLAAPAPMGGDQFGRVVALDGEQMLIANPRGQGAGSLFPFAYDPAPCRTLDVQPSPISPGETLAFQSCGGTPGQLSGLFITHLNGQPQPLLIAFLPYFGDGCWTLGGQYRDQPLTGNTLTFQVYLLGPCGQLELSNPAMVEFQ